MSSNPDHQPTVIVTEKTGASDVRKVPASKLRKFLLIALAVVGLGGGAVFFFSKQGLSEAVLSKLLDDWIADQEMQAKAEGTEVDLRYQSITLKGGLTEQTVEIDNPSIMIAETGLSIADSADRAKEISTKRLLLYPQGVNLENVRIELPDPLNVTYQGQQHPVFTFAPNTPLMVSVKKEVEGTSEFMVVNHYFPTQWKITHLKEQEAGGLEDATPVLTPTYESFTLSAAEGGRYYSRMLKDGTLGEGNLALASVAIADEAGQEVFSLKDVKSTWKGAIEQGTMQQHFTLALADIEYGDSLPELAPYAPQSLAIDASLSAPEGDVSGQTMKLNLSQMKLAIGNASLSLTGNLETKEGEMLPLGQLDASVSGLSALLAQLQRDGVVDAAAVKSVQDTANQIGGGKADLSGEFAFSITRQPGAGMMVGKAPLENLLATVLSSAFKGISMQPHSGAAGAAQEPASGAQ